MPTVPVKCFVPSSMRLPVTDSKGFCACTHRVGILCQVHELQQGEWRRERRSSLRSTKEDCGVAGVRRLQGQGDFSRWLVDGHSKRVRELVMWESDERVSRWTDWKKSRLSSRCGQGQKSEQLSGQTSHETPTPPHTHLAGIVELVFLWCAD